MQTGISEITQLLGNTTRNIILNEKNLIIVGNNGSGKTNLLLALNNLLTQLFVDYRYVSTTELFDKLERDEEFFKTANEYTDSYYGLKQSINNYKSQLEERKFLDIIFNDIYNVLQKIQSQKAIYRFFRANRSYSDSNGGHLTSIDSMYNDFSNATKSIPVYNYFERFLVSMSNYALIEKGSGNIDEYIRVSNIILKIQEDLKELFEDESLELSYNTQKLRMEIIQNGKDPYGLSNLPSGYASILAVYSEIIMLTELNKIKRHELSGIVLIDEIDAHLHVTLQKKVFSFFSKSFPEIQFLVTTHSPFVVQSVSDAVIYNISTNEQLEDLSIYSYTAIIKALLGESTNSDNLDNLLDELRILSDNNDYGDRYKELMTLLNKQFNNLDSRSQAIILNSKSKFIDWEEGQPNV